MIKKQTKELLVVILVIGIITLITTNQSPSFFQERKATISEPDFRNYYGISWRGTACENIDYAKSMGYDYVSYQSGMEKCPNANNLRFYITDPDSSFSMPMYEVCPSNTYTSAQIQTYNDYFLWKSNSQFPSNLATGWFFSAGNCFRPLPDFQQQRIIDDMVQRGITKALSRENKANNFTFGGWVWDVPSLEGDLWNGYQDTGGYQIDIDDWTGNCSGIKHPGVTYEYDCYVDGRAAYIKKLFSETKKSVPDMKVIMEPYHLYNDWIKEISNRSDAAQLMPGLLLEEGRDLQFITDSRNFVLGMSKNTVGYTSPDITVNRDKQFLNFSGTAAINGAWSAFLGRFGTGNYAYSSITLVPAREKMVKVFPVWDNVNQVPLNERSWDANNLIYQSTNTFASMNVIYSRHPKNGNIYAQIDNAQGKITLPAGTSVKEIYYANNLMQQTTRADNDFNINDRELTLKDNSRYGQAYIIITQTTINNQINNTVCTADAKQCGDGSFVGRNFSNNCEWNACPNNNNPNPNPKPFDLVDWIKQQWDSTTGKIIIISSGVLLLYLIFRSRKR